MHELDTAFFTSWSARRPGQTRSLAFAAAVGRAWGVLPAALPTVVVVGSKGKATTAITAAAALTGAGARVGLVTSPHLRSARERIRVDGAAIAAADFAALSAELAAVLAALPAPGHGYLSVTGAVMLGALRHFAAAGVDVAVIEAGIGGTSDEVSLLDPAVVALSTILGEHRDLLGPELADIARNKTGVVTPATAALVSTAQEPAVWQAVTDTAWRANPGLRVRQVPARGSHRDTNQHLGVAAAAEFVDWARHRRPAARHWRAPALPAGVALPGRASVHRDPAGRSWMLDACVDGTGAAAAVAACRAELGEPAAVLVSLPASKDRDGVLEAVAGLPLLEVTPARASGPERAEDLAAVPERGPVLALGGWWFIGRVAAALGVDTERAYPAPATG